MKFSRDLVLFWVLSRLSQVFFFSLKLLLVLEWRGRVAPATAGKSPALPSDFVKCGELAPLVNPGLSAS